MMVAPMRVSPLIADAEREAPSAFLNESLKRVCPSFRTLAIACPLTFLKNQPQLVRITISVVIRNWFPSTNASDVEMIVVAQVTKIPSMSLA
jgi:hypothetical protein